MKSDGALEAINGLGNNIPKAQRILFAAIIEDSHNMEQKMDIMEKKMSNLEQKVDGVEKKVDAMQGSVDRLSNLIEASINQKQSFWKLLSELKDTKWFWIWLLIITAVIAGLPIGELTGFFK